MSQLSPSATSLILLLLAPIIGSFLALVAERWPQGRTLLGRSQCASCGATLRAWHLIPLVSYALQRGRCRYCAGPIPIRLWMTEWAALLVAMPALYIPTPEAAVMCVFLGWTLLLLAELDRQHFWLPDILTLGLCLAGALYIQLYYPAVLLAHALAGISAYAFIWLLNRIYKRLRKRDGLGMGDAKLLAAAAIWLGPMAMPMHLLLASTAALAAAWIGRDPIKKETEVPLGLFLSFAFYTQWLVAHLPNVPQLQHLLSPGVPALPG